MTKISGYGEDTNPSVNGYTIGNDAAGTTKKIKWQNILNMVLGNAPDWQSWTPTTTAGIVVGSGTVEYKYERIGHTVRGTAYFKFGTGSSVSDNWGFSPPVPASTSAQWVIDAQRMAAGQIYFENKGVTAYGGLVYYDASSGLITVRPFSNIPSVVSNMSAGTPFTWGTTDYITAHFEYQV